VQPNFPLIGIEKPEESGCMWGKITGQTKSIYSENDIEAWHVEAMPGSLDLLVRNCPAKKSLFNTNTWPVYPSL